jgi:glutamate--cysteine ligase catalytic subunit
VLWGDELEYGIFRTDPYSENVDLSVGSGAKLQATLSQQPAGIGDELRDWHPEYGSWMIEGVPRQPYDGDTLTGIMQVQSDMQSRRKHLARSILPSEIIPSVTCFPMLGVGSYLHARTEPANIISESKLVADSAINPHPRFGALTRNIRERRGSSVDIVLPVDPCPDKQASSEQRSTRAEEQVHLDAMAFGMGCCCLQVTLQSQTEDQSRHLHDQLGALSPLLHALSASTPIAHGRLLATDTRWSLISQAVDDRTPAERRGAEYTERSVEAEGDIYSVGDGVRRLPQSRYSDSPLYITRPRSEQEAAALQRLNDVPAPVDEPALKALREGGVDEVLARHVSHLFTRDPLVVFEDQINLDNDASMVSSVYMIIFHARFQVALLQFLQDHFESIQSTNWRSMRWKPPALEVGLKWASSSQGQESAGQSEDPAAMVAATEDDDIGPGWRNEVRALEIQLTDFENAAFAVLVVLLSKFIMSEGLSVMLPMSLVHENMRRAQLKDAVLTQKFWFRRDLRKQINTNTQSITVNQNQPQPAVPVAEDMELVEMSLDEIINGERPSSGESQRRGTELFPGLLPTLRMYVQDTFAEAEPEAVKAVLPYLDLLSQRASGRLPTAARWMRNFVTRHPHYERGSGRLNPQVANDLLRTCHAIGMGEARCEELYGPAGAQCVPRLSDAEVPQTVYQAVYHGCAKQGLDKNRSCLSNCV